MLEIRDTVAIGSVGDYLRKNKDELQTIKTKLDKDIQEICNYYIGKDANLIAGKFLEASNKLNQYMETTDYYGSYMNGLSNYDKENIKTSSGSLQSVVNDQGLLNKNTEIVDSYDSNMDYDNENMVTSTGNLQIQVNNQIQSNKEMETEV